MASSLAEFLSITSDRTDLGHVDGKHQGLSGVGLDQMAIPKRIIPPRKVEWASAVPGHSGGPLGFRRADLRLCSVSALVANSSSKLSVPCSTSLADPIPVQMPPITPQFTTIFFFSVPSFFAHQ